MKAKDIFSIEDGLWVYFISGHFLKTEYLERNINWDPNWPPIGFTHGQTKDVLLLGMGGELLQYRFLVDKWQAIPLSIK